MDQVLDEIDQVLDEIDQVLERVRKDLKKVILLYRVSYPDQVLERVRKDSRAGILSQRGVFRIKYLNKFLSVSSSVSLSEYPWFWREPIAQQKNVLLAEL